MKKLTTCKICLIIIIAFFIFCAADCSKDKDKLTYYMPQDFKDYVVFPEGSYWIYEDSVSGNIDSVYLMNSDVSIKETSYKMDYNYEELNQILYLTKYPTLDKSTINAFSSLYASETYEYIGYGWFVDITKLINFSHIANIYDSINVNNITYENVICTCNNDSNLYFWVKNIGLIKKNVNDETWLLKRYYINN